MKTTTHQNPFNHAYITEAIGSAAELLAHYSYRPQAVLEDLKAGGNVILTGRKGVGKTMLLRLFDREIVAEAYATAGTETRHHTPSATVGVYVNLASPILRVRAFHGEGESSSFWRAAFGDYVNCLVMQDVLRGLATLTAIEEWRKDSRWKGEPFERQSGLVERLLAALKIESSIFEHIGTAQELGALIRERLKAWVRFLNRDEGAQSPPTPLPLGVPLFCLVRTVREACPKFRVFVLVDQYEVLHALRGRVDLRPVFNQAMSEASRGGTGVEFKIGSRPYSHGDLGLLDGASVLERGREVDLVDLDAKAGEYFPKLAADLVVKRLRNAGYKVEGSATEVCARLAPGFGGPDEAARYMRHARGTARTLSAYDHVWKSHGMSDALIQEVKDILCAEDVNPLISTLGALWISKWIARGQRVPPWVASPAAAAVMTKSEKVLAIARAFRVALVERYDLGTTKARRVSSATRAADDFVSDWEAAALFRVASSYKNQRKYYAGFETLTRVSSNVALTFILFMKRAWDINASRPGAAVTIPPEVQSEAVHAESEQFFAAIAREYEYGVLQEQVVSALGRSCRRTQMDPCATVPAPNGFSGPPATWTEEDVGRDPRGDSRALLQLLVSWGLLEQSDHQDKTSGKPRRRRYYLNRALCPYFGLTELHLKDPTYVDDAAAYVASLRSAADHGPLQDRQPSLF